MGMASSVLACAFARGFRRANAIWAVIMCPPGPQPRETEGVQSVRQTRPMAIAPRKMQRGFCFFMGNLRGKMIRWVAEGSSFIDHGPPEQAETRDPQITC